MVHSFGPFRFDTEQRLLFRGGEPVPLFPKALDILHVLLEQRGCVVEKSELLRRVWPDTTIEEVGLARNISLLRKALEEGSGGVEFIETIPRRGYRFAGRAGVTDNNGGRRRRVWWAVGATVVLLAVGIYWQFYWPSRYVPDGGAAVAVVPFECLCGAGDGDFAAGLTNVVAAETAQLPGVQVTAPSTVRRHQRAGISMGLMGRLLALDALVEGTVQTVPGRYRLTVNLTDVHTGKIIRADVFDEPAADAATAQADAARRVVAGVAEALRKVSEGNPKKVSGRK